MLAPARQYPSPLAGEVPPRAAVGGSAPPWSEFWKESAIERILVLFEVLKPIPIFGGPHRFGPALPRLTSRTPTPESQAAPQPGLDRLFAAVQ